MELFIWLADLISQEGEWSFAIVGSGTLCVQVPGVIQAMKQELFVRHLATMCFVMVRAYASWENPS